jgi:hypothetical protein
MDDIQDQIQLLQVEINKLNSVIAEAVRKRRAAGKDSPLFSDIEAEIVEARKAVTNLEVKLRALYESKED